MRKLHTFALSEQPLAGMYKELLSTEGVACLIRNERLSAALGEIPFVECYPELWVVDDEAYPRARTLLDGWLKTDPKGVTWDCPNCHERIAGQFMACWSCGHTQN